MPSFFPTARFILLVFTPPPLQPRLVEIQPTWELQTLEPVIAKNTTSLPPRGLWTVTAMGRPRSRMGESATRPAVAGANGRPDAQSASLVSRASFPVLHGQQGPVADPPPGRLDAGALPPRPQGLHEPRRPALPLDPLPPPPRRDPPELALHNHVRGEARRSLCGLQVSESLPGTFAGVCGCPGVERLVAEQRSPEQTLDWPQAHSSTLIFVVSSSNSMAWCRQDSNASGGDGVFASNGSRAHLPRTVRHSHSATTPSRPLRRSGPGPPTLWVDRLSYLANHTLPDSPVLKVSKPETALLPERVGIAADPPSLLKYRC